MDVVLLGVASPVVDELDLEAGSGLPVLAPLAADDLDVVVVCDPLEDDPVAGPGGLALAGVFGAGVWPGTCSGLVGCPA